MGTQDAQDMQCCHAWCLCLVKEHSCGPLLTLSSFGKERALRCRVSLRSTAPLRSSSRLAEEDVQHEHCIGSSNSSVSNHRIAFSIKAVHCEQGSICAGPSSCREAASGTQSAQACPAIAHNASLATLEGEDRDTFVQECSIDFDFCYILGR